MSEQPRFEKIEAVPDLQSKEHVPPQVQEEASINFQELVASILSDGKISVTNLAEKYEDARGDAREMFLDVTEEKVLEIIREKVDFSEENIGYCYGLDHDGTPWDPINRKEKGFIGVSMSNHLSIKEVPERNLQIIAGVYLMLPNGKKPEIKVYLRLTTMRSVGY
ncbi:MAG: hypothetical protein AAB693_01605 [Patescibacteria group bacterium]